MDIQPTEMVYVAIGSDLADGFATLEWTLRRWSSNPLSVVILYADNSVCRDYVYTPIGKIPASSVREEKLKVLEKSEEVKTDKILSKYVAFCGKVKAEGLKIYRYDEPLQKVLVELITSLRITKLVMAFSFMGFSSWKSRSTVSAAFYVHRQKPDFCELFVVCGGKLLKFKEENNEGFIEDDHGAIVAKLREKISFRGWLGKMLTENAGVKNHCDLPYASASNGSSDPWDKHSEEIEQYFNQLLSSNAEEGDSVAAIDTLVKNPPELNMPENRDAAEKIEDLQIKIGQIQEEIQSNRKKAMASSERYGKAKWAVGLCTNRAHDLEARINQENAKRMDLQKSMEITKEELFEHQSEVEEKRTKLDSILELQRELSNKLQLSSSAKSRTEIQLEKAVLDRAAMVQEIEELRRQRDVFQRRIEFCREKDAIGLASKMGELGFDYRKFNVADIRAATDNFSERLRLKLAGDWLNVYRGRINQTTVAIKLFDSVEALSEEAFLQKVKFLSHIRHPHILGMVGFCTELKCIVFEYMCNGCLRDTLFSSPRSYKGRRQDFGWHSRVRIAAEVCRGLSFLHKAKPWPVIHGSLNPSKILLDGHNVAKIYGFKPCWSKEEGDIRPDIQAFGNLILQLLTGRNWAGLAGDAITMDSARLTEALDKMAGKWPLDLALELGGIAKRCLSIDESLDKEFSSKLLMKWVDKVRRKADEIATNEGFAVADEGDGNSQDLGHVPNSFICPIYQDVMKNPQVAADGFSYELEAIEEWLRAGHDSSPMTNLRLKHKLLTPNQTLRSLIQDWHNKRSIPFT